MAEVCSKLSSANIAHDVVGELTDAGKSLTYIRNSRGPNTDPCGTPEVTASDGDIPCSIEVQIYRPVR